MGMDRLTIDEAINRARNGALDNGSEMAERINGMLDVSECKKYAEQHEQLSEWLQELKAYRDLEEQGKLLKLPCAVGDTVYVITECVMIPKQLDGTLYDSNGGLGTATGYYCPYENNCPFDGEEFDGCEKYENQTAVFEDTVSSITIEDNAVYVTTDNCCVCSEIRGLIFLTKEEAETALQKMKETEE